MRNARDWILVGRQELLEGIASGSGDDNGGYESDGSVDEDAIESIISGPHSLMNGMPGAGEGGGIVTR